jgi:hypothetical protein
LVHPENAYSSLRDKYIIYRKKVMMSFLSDWWEAFIISGCYEMGDPLAPSEVEGNREGGGFTRS